MKKISVMLLAVPLMLAACGASNPSASTPASPSGDPSTPTSQSITPSSSTSTSVSPTEDEATVVKNLLTAIDNTQKMSKGTLIQEEVMDYGGMAETETITSTFDGADFYSKDYKNASNIKYEIVSLKNDKYVDSVWTKGESTRSSTCEVDETYGRDNIFYDFLEPSGKECLEYYQNFTDLGVVVLKSFVRSLSLDEPTLDDLNVNKTIGLNQEGEMQINVSLDSKSKWCETQTYMGYPLNKLDVSFEMRYHNQVLTHYSNSLGLEVKDSETTTRKMQSDSKYTIKDSFDENIKNEVTTEDAKIAYLETISPLVSQIGFYINGYNQVASETFGGFKDKTSATSKINEICFTNADSIESWISPIASEVNVKYEFIGKEKVEFNKTSIDVTPKACYKSNEVHVSVTPKDPTKCVVTYYYNKHVIGGGAPKIEKKIVFKVVDKTENYKLETTEGGIEYTDLVTFNSFSLSVNDGKFNISKLDTAYFYCLKKIPYDKSKVDESQFKNAITQLNNCRMSLETSDTSTKAQEMVARFDINNDKAELYVDGDPEPEYLHFANPTLYLYVFDTDHYVKTPAPEGFFMPNKKFYDDLYEQYNSLTYSESVHTYSSSTISGYDAVELEFDQGYLKSATLVTSGVNSKTYSFTDFKMFGEIPEIELPDVE